MLTCSTDGFIKCWRVYQDEEELKIKTEQMNKTNDEINTKQFDDLQEMEIVAKQTEEQVCIKLKPSLQTIYYYYIIIIIQLLFLSNNCLFFTYDDIFIFIFKNYI